jgi:hypothetical protein
MMVTVLDDDTWGMNLAPTALTLSEPDGKGVFTLTLSSQPTDVVSVPLVSMALEQCTVSPGMVELDATNWAGGVTGTVTVVDDAIADGTQPCLVQTGPAISGDPLYSGLNPKDVAVTVLDDDRGGAIFLPLMMRRWPPPPDPPVLAPIDNTDGDGTYSVQWSSVSGAVLYTLEESSNVMMSDAREISVGSATSHLVTQRGAGRHYYRVKARNQWFDSEWSTLRAVDVLWEAEPNDQAQSQANGPLISGLTYYGRLPSGADLQDYYYIDLLVPHSVELWLTDIPSGQNYDLVLRDAGLVRIGYSANWGNVGEHILTGFVPAGRYYIQVYNRGGGGSSQPYRLSTVHD